MIPVARTHALGLALLAIASGCQPPRCIFPAAAITTATAPTPEYRYRVGVGPGAEELCVEADLPIAHPSLLASAAIEPFVRDVAIDRGAGFASATLAPSGWSLGDCAHGCRVRYRLLLGEASRLLDDDVARAHRGAFLSPPSTWMLRPGDASPDARYRLSVTTSPGVNFVTGVFHDATDGATSIGRLGDLGDAPYAAFGAFTRTRVALPGGTLDIALLGGEPSLGRARAEAWIEAQARAVATYFGRLPIAHAAVLAMIEPGAGIANGRTMGNGGASVILSMGDHTTAGDLERDWVLVHELCHVAFPNVLRPWAEEGLSTYLEPIIRARAGTHSHHAVWHDLLEGLPQGQPAEGDQGLDHTDTWGRRYWGGAMFWLLADVTIRKQTAGAHSLDDALRAIAREGGNVAITWPLERALSLGDRATDTQVLTSLRAKLGEQATTVDLAALWKDLGVRLDDGAVTYDESAPSAAIRRAITAPEGR